MPAVIQRMIWEKDLPVIETAVRSDALFVEHEWTWSRVLADGTEFADREAAEVQGKKLDARAFPVIRAARQDARLEISPTLCAAREGARLEIPPTLCAARRELRSDEVFAATQRRLGEHG